MVPQSTVPLQIKQLNLTPNQTVFRSTGAVNGKQNNKDRAQNDVCKITTIHLCSNISFQPAAV